MYVPCVHKVKKGGKGPKEDKKKKKREGTNKTQSNFVCYSTPPPPHQENCIMNTKDASVATTGNEQQHTDKSGVVIEHVLDFLVVTIHGVLYTHRVYPRGTFVISALLLYAC